VRDHQWAELAADTFAEGREQIEVKLRKDAFEKYFVGVLKLLSHMEYERNRSCWSRLFSCCSEVPPHLLEENAASCGAKCSIACGLFCGHYCCGNAAGENLTPMNGPGGFAAIAHDVCERYDIVAQVDGFDLAELERERQAAPDAKVVNLILPAHRSGILDGVMIWKMRLPNFLVFANGKELVPRVELGCMRIDFVEMFALRPEMIHVGGVDTTTFIPTPTDKLVDSLEKKISRYVVNYPQGMVAAGGEFFPISKVFVEKLLYRLLVEGFTINIIPVANAVDNEFLMEAEDYRDKRYTVRVHPPLRHHLIKELVKMQLGLTEADLTQAIAARRADLDQAIAEQKPKPAFREYAPQAGENRPRIFDRFLLALWQEHTPEQYGDPSLRWFQDRIKHKLQIEDGEALRADGYLDLAVLRADTEAGAARYERKRQAYERDLAIYQQAKENRKRRELGK
jgi:hypothetical protein